MSNPFIITGTGVTESGITFVPGNGAPCFDGMTIPEVIMWDDADQVEVQVTADAVFITTELADTTNRYISAVTRRTTCYRCPVTIVSYRVDFSLGSDDGTYVPSSGVQDFGMFSDEGNLAVECAILAAIDADNITTVADVQAAVTGHPEINDTVVREYIHAALFTAGLIREDA